MPATKAEKLVRKNQYDKLNIAISPEMARRIEAWLGPERGGRAEIRLGMQMDYDLRVAEQKPAPKATRAPELLAACWEKSPPRLTRGMLDGDLGGGAGKTERR